MRKTPLSFDGNLMFCKWCKSQKCENTFTAGTNNFRTSTYKCTCHIETADHQYTWIPKDEQANMQNAVDNLLAKEEKAISVALKTVYFMPKEGNSLSKYPNMIGFLKELCSPP